MNAKVQSLSQASHISSHMWPVAAIWGSSDVGHFHVLGRAGCEGGILLTAAKPFIFQREGQEIITLIFCTVGEITAFTLLGNNDILL